MRRDKTLEMRAEKPACMNNDILLGAAAISDDSRRTQRGRDLGHDFRHLANGRPDQHEICVTYCSRSVATRFVDNAAAHRGSEGLLCVYNTYPAAPHPRSQ